MPSYAPASRVELFRPASFGASSARKIADLNTLLRADMSLPVSDGLGQASLVFADPGGHFLARYAPQPMDIVRVWGNSRLKAAPVVVWTGFLNDVSSHTETQQYGQTLILQATTPYLLWENTSFLLSADGATNDAATLALAYVGGIGGRDLITFTAKRVRFPGPLGALKDPETGQPNPAGVHLYGTDPKTGRYTAPEYVGQRNWSLPDNLWSNPDLQHYGTVLQALVADTGMVLYCDEFGSLVFAPIPYLNLPNNPRILDPIEIIDMVLDASETGIVTEVRVAWLNTYVYSDYAIGPQDKSETASAISTLEGTIGKRVLTLNQPWINSLPSAQFLANELIRQYAAGVAKGQVTILADPGCRTGSVIGIRVPNGGGAIQYYGVSNVIDSWTYGGAWVRTLQLVYGRDVQQSYPLVGVLQAPTPGKESFGGIPGMTNGGIVNPLSKLISAGGQALFQTGANPALGSDSVWAPYPVGTVLQLRDANGKPLPTGNHGEYTVTKTLGAGVLPPIQLLDPGGVNQVVVTVLTMGQATDAAGNPTTPDGDRTQTDPNKTSTSPTDRTGPPSPTSGADTAKRTLGFPPANLAQRALGIALTEAGRYYPDGRPYYVLGGQADLNGGWGFIPNHADGGPEPQWDCVGLVFWAYSVARFGWTLRRGPVEMYTFFKNTMHAPEIPLDQASVGDLVFYGADEQHDHQHVGFVYKVTPGHLAETVIFSALSSTRGIGSLNVYDMGMPLTHVLNMQNVEGPAPGGS